MGLTPEQRIAEYSVDYGFEVTESVTEMGLTPEQRIAEYSVDYGFEVTESVDEFGGITYWAEDWFSACSLDIFLLLIENWVYENDVIEE